MAGDHDDDAIAERISGPLRAHEKADASFTERVMSAVREAAAEERTARRRPWLVRSRPFRMAPLAALALAAGVVLLGFGTGSLWTGARIKASAPVAATDTVHVVRFVFSDGATAGARQVLLVGSFNNWTKGAAELVPHEGSGVWSVSLPLPAGRHNYAFVVVDTHGERWVADPAALRVRDEFGTESSVLSVGGTI